MGIIDDTYSQATEAVGETGTTCWVPFVRKCQVTGDRSRPVGTRTVLGAVNSLVAVKHDGEC